MGNTIDNVFDDVAGGLSDLGNDMTDDGSIDGVNDPNGMGSDSITNNGTIGNGTSGYSFNSNSNGTIGTNSNIPTNNGYTLGNSETTGFGNSNSASHAGSGINGGTAGGSMR